MGGFTKKSTGAATKSDAKQIAEGALSHVIDGWYAPEPVPVQISVATKFETNIHIGLHITSKHTAVKSDQYALLFEDSLIGR
jgi:hypothetical protein